MIESNRNGAERVAAGVVAQGRIHTAPPVAVIDIGSNSVRLVVYEGLARSLTPIFNEKVLAGLGREVLTTGLLPRRCRGPRRLAALARFRALCDAMRVGEIFAIATAACRDARNGAAFIAEAEQACGVAVEIVSGAREAELSALGVVSGFHKPDGIVGDLGGGSLELSDVRGRKLKAGTTLPLGGLALQDLSAKSLDKAEKIVRDALGQVNLLKAGRDRDFYCVGGTWRSLTRLHMWQTGYPLHVMHGYVIPAAEALEFSALVRRVDAETLSRIEIVNAARRPLLAYAALVLEHVVRSAGSARIVVSALGVREGLLVRHARRRGAKARPAARGGAGAQRAAVALAPPRRGTRRLERPLHGDLRPAGKRRRKAACAAPPACSPISAGGRIRTIAASRPSTSSPTPPSSASIIPAGPFWRWRCSSAMPAWSKTNCRRICASSRPPACSTAPACSAPPCGSPTWCPGRCRACCPIPRMVVERGKLKLTLAGKYRNLAGDRVFSRLRQLARLIGREPLMVTE